MVRKASAIQKSGGVLAPEFSECVCKAAHVRLLPCEGMCECMNVTIYCAMSAGDDSNFAAAARVLEC